ncbi:hypothetical protein Tco_1188641 [Tanacetum coccineum]
MPVMPPPSTYEVGGPSIAAAEGQSFTLPAPGFPVPSLVIKDLSTRMGNLEYGYGQLLKKVIQIGAGRYPDGAGLAGCDLARRGDYRIESVGAGICILRIDRRLADLERRPPGPQ